MTTKEFYRKRAEAIKKVLERENMPDWEKFMRGCTEESYKYYLELSENEPEGIEM